MDVNYCRNSSFDEISHITTVSNINSANEIRDRKEKVSKLSNDLLKITKLIPKSKTKSIGEMPTK
jgi:hypothetical protein